MATQLIYKAALKSGTVSLANGKLAVYRDITAEHVPDFSCWLCGRMLDVVDTGLGGVFRLGIPVTKAIKPTFTDANLAAAPYSKAICKGCAFCLSYRELRNYSIFATIGGLRHPARSDWRQILLDPPTLPFVACIALSGQRWLHIRAKIAHSRDNYPVQVEDMLYYVERGLLAHLGQLIDEMYITFTKDEIRTGDYQPHRVQVFGVQRFCEFDSEISSHRGTRMFELALLTAQRVVEKGT